MFPFLGHWAECFGDFDIEPLCRKDFKLFLHYKMHVDYAHYFQYIYELEWQCYIMYFQKIYYQHQNIEVNLQKRNHHTFLESVWEE